MLEWAQDAVAWLGVADAQTLGQDKMRAAAVERAVQIVGEAAWKMSEAGKAAAPDLPWAAIAGARHILVHDYGRIDLTTLVEIVQQHLPTLIDRVNAALRGMRP